MAHGFKSRKSCPFANWVTRFQVMNVAHWPSQESRPCVTENSMLSPPFFQLRDEADVTKLDSNSFVKWAYHIIDSWSNNSWIKNGPIWTYFAQLAKKNA